MVIVFFFGLGLVGGLVPGLKGRCVIGNHVEVHVSFGKLRGGRSEILELSVDEHAIYFNYIID